MSKKPVIGVLRTKADVALWMEGNVLGDLRTLEAGTELYHERTTKKDSKGRTLGGGNYLLAAGCCMALQYFAYVFHGTSKDSTNVERFVSEFLEPVNPRYGEAGVLLWRCFRDGIVHGSWPKAIYIEGGFDNRLVTGASTGGTGLHLAADPTITRDSFVIHSPQLLRDLEAAFDPGFRHWLLEESDDEVVKRASPQHLVVNPGDKVGVKQIESVRRWQSASGPA